MGFGDGRNGAIVAAAVSAAAATSEVITKTETVFLNVPLSMLYVAIAGTMIGIFLLPAKEAARINKPSGTSLQRRSLYLLLTAGMLVSVVLAYAFIAAWTVQTIVALAMTMTRLAVDESLVLPITGLVGVGIRPWLPSLLKAVERRADRVIGGDP